MQKNSNTTLVKVKWNYSFPAVVALFYSNTTLVKVKLSGGANPLKSKKIQIQHLLKLNYF